MRYKLLFASLLIAFGMGIWILGSDSRVSDISQNIVRLHIIANSNTEKDQSVKYAVRDCLLENSRKLNKDANYEYFVSHLDEAVSLSDSVVSEFGCDYKSKAETGKFYFPTKRYENIILPAGEYEAVRIVLGDGKGENWWCVMYPPLCFSNKTFGELGEEEMAQLKSAMSEESFEMISTDGEEIIIKPAFKFVELWQKIKNSVKSKI